jgi:hypothetical protein
MSEQQVEKSARHKQLEARQERIQARKPKPQMVRVVPKNDAIRKYIKHLPSGIAFPESGAAEWPLDNFTRRRLRDGDVTIEEQKAEAARPRPRAHGDV